MPGSWLHRGRITVLLFDHAGRDISKGTRGSSQKLADVDAVWQMTTRSKGGLTLKRTHNRTRHGQDILYLQREDEPLKHVITSVDKRTEEIIQTCFEWMWTTDLDPSLSGREVLKQAKNAGHHYRDDTIREA